MLRKRFLLEQAMKPSTWRLHMKNTWLYKASSSLFSVSAMLIS
ncbi:hypothetical protein NC651_028347 [Populus alba x Populus x berolinensis]|nr:hypothetical protein NC651_028347 [Populus alba x Populus x berolinensis]